MFDYNHHMLSVASYCHSLQICCLIIKLTVEDSLKLRFKEKCLQEAGFQLINLNRFDRSIDRVEFFIFSFSFS